MSGDDLATAPVGYQPRNVVNAPQIKAAIAQRSARRQDGPKIREWLGNHFFRWCVGSFAHTVPVDSLRSWRVCLPEVAAPDWFQRRLNDGGGSALAEPLHYIDPEHPRLIDAERVMLEFLYASLGSRLERKLHKITYTEALERWHADHARMQRQRQEGWAPSSPTAFRVELVTPNGQFVEFASAGQLLRAEMAYESFHMQHCVGDFQDRAQLAGGYGDYYANAIEAGERRILSLRDASNRPHVTVGLIGDASEWRLEQIKGKQNRPPSAKYWPDVIQLINHLQLPVGDVADCAAMGLISVAQPLGEAWGRDAPSGPRWITAPYHQHLELMAAQHLLVAMPPVIAQHPAPPLREQWVSLGAHRSALLHAPRMPAPAVLAASVRSLPGARATLGELNSADNGGPPAWANALLAGADMPEADPVPATPTAADSAPAPAPARRGWMARLLGAGAAPAEPLPTRRLRWAFAVGDLLYLRHRIHHHRNAQFDLRLPEADLAAFRHRVEEELGLPATSNQRRMRVLTWMHDFFAVPYFDHPDFMAHCARAGLFPIDLVAFAAARQAFFLRALTAFGDIPEARAQTLLLLNAQRVQDCFDGWQPFAEAYARGRGTWLTWRHGKDVRRAAEVEVSDYLDTGAGCNWLHLPWRDHALVDAATAWSLAAERVHASAAAAPPHPP